MSEADPAAPCQLRQGHNVNLKNLSTAELLQLIADAETELRHKQEVARTELQAKWEAEAAEAGLSLNAVLRAGASGAGQERKSRKSQGAMLPVKFKGPNGEEWSGRGRLPRWLQAAEADGKKREEFKV